MTPSRAHRSWAVLTENRGKERATGRCSSLNRRAKSGGTGALDTQWQRGHVEAGGVAHGRAWKPMEAGRGESCLLALFNIFTELPLALFFKLLSNLYGNSKISKNKSCSKFKVLQLCFNNHTQILSTFNNASLK